MLLQLARAIDTFRRNTGGLSAAIVHLMDCQRREGWRRTLQRSVRFIQRYGRIDAWNQRPGDGPGSAVMPQKPRTTVARDLRAWQEEVLTGHADAHEEQQRIARANGPCGVGAIAFYLPQFHTFAENDAWWGVGFTEWRNVTRSLPQYVSHYQPRQPADLGFYDLRTPGVLLAQAAMARRAGLSGFCFYYYWFAGRPLMEVPLQAWAAEPEIDFPYCLCWANENWTRRWDGLEQDVLLAQQHSPEDDLAFIAHIERYLSDPRYLRLDGKPLLLVYRAALLPDAASTVARWRAWWRERHGGELFLACVCPPSDKQHDTLARFGFDASVEFPPVGLTAQEIDWKNKAPPVASFTGRVYDYQLMAAQSKAEADSRHLRFRGVMPSWDNTARRRSGGFIFDGSTPQAYRSWLHESLTFSRWFPCSSSRRQFVFINAWNEWAEGAYLEPDLRYGYAFLNATADALGAWQDTSPQCLQAVEPKSTIACILHLHYPELAKEFCDALAGLPCDLWITLTDRSHFEMVSRLFPSAQIYWVPNRGRDIGPFLAIASKIAATPYRLCLKLHSKRSLHRVDGDRWRQTLVDNLLHAFQPRLLEALLERHPDVGIVAPRRHVFRLDKWRGSNEPLLARLSRLSGIGIAYDETFVAGSMYWFRPAALAPLFELPLETGDFEFEDGQVDGTLAHALERFTGACVRHAGYRIVDMDDMTKLDATAGTVC